MDARSNYKHEYLDKAKVVTLTEEEPSSDIEFYSVLEYCTNTCWDRCFQPIEQRQF